MTVFEISLNKMSLTQYSRMEKYVEIFPDEEVIPYDSTVQ